MILGIQWHNGIPVLGTSEMYKMLGLLRLNSLFKYNLFKFMKLLLSGHFPDLYDLLLRPYHYTHNYRTRGGMFRHPDLTSEIERRFLPYQMILLYENLPPLLNDNSFSGALRKYKKLLLDEQ